MTALSSPTVSVLDRVLEQEGLSSLSELQKRLSVLPSEIDMVEIRGLLRLKTTILATGESHLEFVRRPEEYDEMVQKCESWICEKFGLSQEDD